MAERALFHDGLPSAPGLEVEVHRGFLVDANEQFVMPWRLPFDELDLYHESLVDRASVPAGVRLVFVSDTSRIDLDVEPSGVHARWGM